MSIRIALLFPLALVVACGGRETTTVTTTNGPRKVNIRTIPENENKKRADDLVRVDQPPSFMKKSLLGTKLDAQGNVVEEKSTFRKGEPVYLTMILKDSPVGLQTHVSWLRARDNSELHAEMREMKGAKVVTFALGDPNLEPGKYRVIGYWGGNVAADKPFEIVAK
jgi:hypothetical protein